MQLNANLFLISIMNCISSFISLPNIDNDLKMTYVKAANYSNNEFANPTNYPLRNLSISSLRCENYTYNGDYLYYTFFYHQIQSSSATDAEKAESQIQFFLPSVGTIFSNGTGEVLTSGQKVNFPFVLKYKQEGFGYYTYVKFNFVYRNIISPDCYNNYYICNNGCKACSTTN